MSHHPLAPFLRWLLIVGAVAMSLTGVLAGAHVALVHHCAADAADHTDGSDCGVCLHWQHRALAGVALVDVPEPQLAGVVEISPSPTASPRSAPVPCGRAPPAPVTATA